jgi:hypothetical protein
MDISNTASIVTIKGNIKSIGDFQAIKTCLDTIAEDTSSISINIVDSISITSSVIGYFTKLVYNDKINIILKVGDKRLYHLLDELSLISIFNVQKSLS